MSWNLRKCENLSDERILNENIHSANKFSSNSQTTEAIVAYKLTKWISIDCFIYIQFIHFALGTIYVRCSPLLQYILSIEHHCFFITFSVLFWSFWILRNINSFLYHAYRILHIAYRIPVSNLSRIVECSSFSSFFPLVFVNFPLQFAFDKLKYV